MRAVGVLGAKSVVGYSLLPVLKNNNIPAVAFSRSSKPNNTNGIDWRHVNCLTDDKSISDWISLLPIWVLVEYLDELKTRGTKRIIALSSTSRFTKVGSLDETETSIATRIIAAEKKLDNWAKINNVICCILRPTLIYGNGLDQNICEISRLINRFGFFPIIGEAKGKRQPVHVDDVSYACLRALEIKEEGVHYYELSGGEILTYRDMILRIFQAMNMKPYLITVPLSLYRMGIIILKWFPRYKNWSVTMAERMNQDMVFDHLAASKDLGFKPRSFRIDWKDLPRL